MTETPEDFIDLLQCFREANVKFAIVGAYALAVHGHPRATQDIDIWVKPDLENAKKIYQALLDFGAPVRAHSITADDFAIEGNVYQIGLPPARIDILTSIAGVSFVEAEPDFIEGSLGNENVKFIGIVSQIKNKRAAGRSKDIADAEILEELLKKNS